jgi:DHA1 family bicyclomycin/chloramphenicol resistance-like MFS transporter
MIASQSRWFIILLGALMMVNALSIDMILPALPALAATLHTSPDQVQLTMSIYLIGYAAGQFLVGPLSDRFGRRPVLLGGLSLYTLATLACAASPRIDALVAARLVQGFAACGGPVVVRAIVRDHVGGDRAAHMMSSLTIVFSLAPLLAPLIGGALLVRWGWPSIFLCIALFAAVLVVLAWFGLAESHLTPDREALRLSRLAANYRTFLTTRAAVGFAIVNGLCWIGIFAFLSASPFVFIEYYGVRPDHYGYYFGLCAVTIICGATVNKRLLRRMSSLRVMQRGFAILICGGIAVMLVPLTPWSGPLAVMAAVMLFTFGQALVQPNAVAQALEPLKHMAGMGSALMGIIQMLCGAAGGYVVNALYDGTPRPMGAVILFAAVACVAVYALLLPHRPLRPAE